MSQMKFIAIPILMLLIATQAFSKWVMLLEFKWNQDYIAQNLCENKAKPKLKCEGNCQLTKMMAAEEHDTAPLKNNTRSALAEVLFSFEPVITVFSFPSCKKTLHHSTDKCWKHILPVFSIFHPPAV